MPPSRLDAIYRSLLLTKFFTRGWGKPENLERIFEFRKLISNRETCYNLVPKDYPIEITKEETTSECRIVEGKFTTPLELYLPGLVPKVAQDAHFQMIFPLEWKDPVHKPMCIHFAGTGDHYYWRRRNFIAKPLLKEANIGAILLENPFYGVRKPADQHASSLHNVSDIFVMGGCLALESLVLMNWCERNGYGPLGITGLSMGGHMASLAATNWPKPLVLVPCLSWSTASTAFTQGVMTHSINWDVLETQYFTDGQYREKLSKMVTIIDDAFKAGQHFIQTFPNSVRELQKDIREMNLLTSNDKATAATTTPNTTLPNNSTLPNPQTTSRLLNITATNKLGLSETLLNKLLSTEKAEFTSDEVNELNQKIKLALKKIKEENATATTKDESTKEVVALQSDTSASSDTSTILASAISVGRTKLMSLISPSQEPQQQNLPAISTPAVQKRSRLDPSRVNWWEHEALQFMRGMMDECTHLKNFSTPVDTSLIIAVCAKDDAYIPRDGCSSLEDIWPGAEVRYLDAGHVSAYVLYQKMFRTSIAEGFERAKKVYDAERLELEQIKRGKIIFDRTQSFTDRIREIQVVKR